ncbi:MAG: RagB/SusD family nutrient uptake outer membrane protein [Candidatus Azobacteroides sp.]|nr:RagB/SusD family nutrient uptake outer membrane protein [Candidatus Azobacteroides sp.]
MKQYSLLGILLLALSFSACDLDKEPYGISNFWNTEADVQLAINSAYAPFYDEEGFGRGHWWAGPASDDMVINRNKEDDAALTEFRTTVNASGGQFSNWKLMYKVIRRANDVIKHAASIEMPEENRNLFLGEANFICAYAYFYLAKRYGGLPFYDYNRPEEINKPRETKTETYNRIEAYLKTAIAYYEKQDAWTLENANLGRPNLGAAYGLLAKVYAHWGKYAEAKAAAEKVINSGLYSLDLTDNNGYAHLFSPDGEKHKEVLFNLVNKPIRNQGTVTSVVLLSATLSSGTGWYYFAPTKSLYEAFEPGDLRRKATLVGAGDEVHFLGKAQVLTEADIKDMTTGYMGTKYLAAYNKLSGWNWESGEDIPLLRYADVLLIHAEAEIFLAGGGANNRTLGVPAAAQSFNEVRVRAFGGDASKAIVAPTFNDLVNERRCELAYEDERHYDLVRWGLAQEVYAAATSATDPRGPRTFDPAKDAHFPIPQREIENTDYLLANNPLDGYSNFK